MVLILHNLFLEFTDGILQPVPAIGGYNRKPSLHRSHMTTYSRPDAAMIAYGHEIIQVTDVCVI